MIIKKIVDLRSEASQHIERVVIHATKIIASIEAQAKDIINHLKHFLEICDKKIIEILNLGPICKNNSNSFLEKALMTEGLPGFIDSLTGPNILLKDSGELFTYIPSSLEYSFDNNLPFTVGFPSEYVMTIYPSKKQFTVENLEWHTRILAIDFDKLLITGGGKGINVHNRCYNLNITSGTIYFAPGMKFKRIKHRITWLNNVPCVVGGHDGVRAINNVEILVGDKWIEISPLNIARCYPTAINHKGAIWCIGGVDINDNKLDSIEKYENSLWVILQIKLFEPSFSIGGVCLENSILLYGGRNKNDKALSTAYLIDTDMSIITQMENISTPACFTQTLCHLSAGGIFQYDNHGRLQKIDLKTIIR